MKKQRYEALDQLRELEVEVKKEYQKLNNFLKEYFKELEKTTVTTNLKLYEVAATLKNESDYNDFIDFCEIEYNFFQEFLKEKSLKLSYIGRSSSFYLISYRLPFDINDDYDSFISSVFSYIDLPDIFDYYNFNDYSNAFKKYGYNDYMETLEYDLNIINNIDYNDLNDILNNVKSGYKYINDFKKNQLNIYKGWLLN